MPMSGLERRNAIRKYGRRQGTGFFLGTLCLIICLVIMGGVRDSIAVTIGESAELWLFGIMAFASMLIPPVLVQWNAMKDSLLYCPHCNQFLATFRAVIELNKNPTCSQCSSKIDITPIDKRHASLDLAYMFGGMCVLLGIMLITHKLVS